MELPDGATVSDLLEHLGITQRVKLVVINDEPEPNLGRILNDRDTVRVFPVVVGG